MSIIKQLKENQVVPEMNNERIMARMVKKWAKTGLLKGLKDTKNTRTYSNTVQLLENQAKSLIKEASTVSDGSIEGFAAVAFPLVRRIFGDLIADQIVAVQPMNLPTGLVFFLDFTYTDSKLAYTAGESIYGGGVVGSGIADGVDLDNDKGFYNLNTGYSSPEWEAENVADVLAAATLADDQFKNVSLTGGGAGPFTAAQIKTNGDEAYFDYDADVFTDGGAYEYNVYDIRLASTEWSRIEFDNLVSMLFVDPTAGSNLFGASAEVIRRLTKVVDETNRTLRFVVRATAASGDCPVSTAGTKAINWEFTVDDKYKAGSTLGTVMGEDWHLEGPSTRTSGTGYEDMAELDIKVNSLQIIAQSKKLKAKWSPELGQDLNAYHNIDAEVELTGVLSEHIALEIDREIVNDLVKGATAGTYYWNRNPGNFVNKTTGALITGTSAPDFTGNVSEWYETLLETVNDLSAVIYRKTLKGGANFLVIGPETLSMLEMTNGFRAQPQGPDVSTTSAGIVKAGSISKKWDIYVDVYFPRNLILVGRKGSQFLETGYVYAPYIPLQITPTIFGPEDATPRKMVMTRYGKRMVKPDMYGIVRIINLIQQ
jgi:hypothetical protein